MRLAQPQPVQLAVPLLQRHLARPPGRLRACLCLLVSCRHSRQRHGSGAHKRLEASTEQAMKLQLCNPAPSTGQRLCLTGNLACGNGAESSVARARSGFCSNKGSHSAQPAAQGPTLSSEHTIAGQTRREEQLQQGTCAGRGLLRGGGTAKVKSAASACMLSLPLPSACSCAAGGGMLLQLGSALHTSPSAPVQGRPSLSASSSRTSFRTLKAAAGLTDCHKQLVRAFQPPLAAPRSSFAASSFTVKCRISMQHQTAEIITALHDLHRSAVPVASVFRGQPA